MSKKRTIEELYYRYSNEAHKMTNDVKQLNQELSEKIEQLNNTMTVKQQELLSELLESENIRDDLVNRNVFIYAFSFANKLNKESLK